MSIKTSFDDIARKYDEQRRKLIPCFDDFYYLPLNFIENAKENLKVLDIGSGTGLFSEIVLQKYPQANFTLIDLSEQMLNVAQSRFIDHQDFNYINADYTKYKFNEKFDVIISALSIHHLSDADKKNLYKKCYDCLENGGIFINADQVLSESWEIEDLHYKLWRAYVENSGLDKKNIQAAYERITYDKSSTLNEQLNWLREAGFSAVDSIYKYYHFCVFYARK